MQEVLLTWWLESELSKEEILELYLNVIEYGPDIYGIVAASEHYFGKSPAELTAAEAVFFATILPNPKLFYDSYERGTLSRGTRNRMQRFLRHLNERGRIDEAAMANGLEQIENGFRFSQDGASVETVPMGSTATLPFMTAMPGGDLFDLLDGFDEESYEGGRFDAGYQEDDESDGALWP